MHLLEPTFGVARSAWKFFLPFAVLCVVFFYFGLGGNVVFTVLAGIFAILGGYILYFFRDPERKIPNIPNSVCCPADGKVASVLEVPCEEMPGGRALRVAIFLNIFNVHVQRVPLDGKVTDVKLRPGRCMNALNEKCSEENEAVTVWLDTAFGPVGVRQLTGAIARRIICAARKGMDLDRGARYGIIQFGSRVEVFLPLDATVKVQPGQKVKGGETCLAVLFEHEVRQGLSRTTPASGVANVVAKAG